MRHDLDMYFGLKSELFKQNTLCLVLKKIDPKIAFTTSGEKRAMTIKKEHFRAVNEWFSSILSELNYRVTLGANKVFINETGEDLGARMDIELKGNLNDLEVLNKQLKAYNLQITKENRVLNHLLLTEIP